MKLRLRNTNPFSVSAKVKARGRGRTARKLKASGPAVMLRAGQAVTVTLKLDRADRRLLRRLRKLRLRVALQLRDPAGQTRTVRSTMTLRAPKAKTKRKRG